MKALFSVPKQTKHQTHLLRNFGGRKSTDPGAKLFNNEIPIETHVSWALVFWFRSWGALNFIPSVALTQLQGTRKVLQLFSVASGLNEAHFLARLDFLSAAPSGMLGWSGVPRVSWAQRPKATAKARPSAAAVSSSSSPSSASLFRAALPVRPVLADRSRSPERRALPGLRADAPGRRAISAAKLPNVLSQQDKESALKELEVDVLAASTHRTHQARLRTIDRIMAMWGLKAWPPTPVSLKALASTLKWSGYSSAPVYLSTYRSEAERRGFTLTNTILRNITDYNRSCLRGLGAPARPKPLPHSGTPSPPSP